MRVDMCLCRCVPVSFEQMSGHLFLNMDFSYTIENIQRFLDLIELGEIILLTNKIDVSHYFHI